MHLILPYETGSSTTIFIRWAFSLLWQGIQSWPLFGNNLRLLYRPCLDSFGSATLYLKYCLLTTRKGGRAGVYRRVEWYHWERHHDVETELPGSAFGGGINKFIWSEKYSQLPRLRWFVLWRMVWRCEEGWIAALGSRNSFKRNQKIRNWSIRQHGGTLQIEHWRRCTRWSFMNWWRGWFSGGWIRFQVSFSCSYWGTGFGRTFDYGSELSQL